MKKGTRPSLQNLNVFGSTGSTEDGNNLFGMGKSKQLQMELSAKDSLLEEQQRANAALTDELQKTHAALAATRDTVSRMTNDLQHLQSLQAQVPVLNAANSDMKTVLADLNNRFALVNERCSTLEEQVRTKTDLFNSTKASYDAAKAEIQPLKAETESFRAALSSKESQLRALEKEAETMRATKEKDINSLKKENDAVVLKLKSQQATQIQDLKSQHALQVQDLNATIVALKDQLEQQLAPSIASNQTDSTKLAALEAKLRSDHQIALDEKDSIIAQLNADSRAREIEFGKKSQQSHDNSLLAVKTDYERQLSESKHQIMTLENALTEMKASAAAFNSGVLTPVNSPNRSTSQFSMDQHINTPPLPKPNSQRIIADAGKAQQSVMARKISMSQKSGHHNTAPVRTTSLLPQFDAGLDKRRMDTVCAPTFNESFCNIAISKFSIPDVAGDVPETQAIFFPSHAIGTVCAYMLHNGLSVELNSFSLFAIHAMQTAPSPKSLTSLVFWISNLHQFLCILESLRLSQTVLPNTQAQLVILSRGMDHIYACLEEVLLPNLFEDLSLEIAETADAAVLDGLNLLGKKQASSFALFGLGGGTSPAASGPTNGLLQLNVILSRVGKILRGCHVPIEFRERVLLNMLRAVGLSGFNAVMELPRGSLTPAVARKVDENVETIVGWFVIAGMSSARDMVDLLKEVMEAVLMDKKSVPEDVDDLLSSARKVGINRILHVLDHCCSFETEESLAMSPQFHAEMRLRSSTQKLGLLLEEAANEPDPIETEITVEPLDCWVPVIPSKLSLPENMKLLLA
ncbi:hypothetical protein BJ741DRAFT_586391 [Chytriomyces cf. hyalinus JEL632]|nr:hypothetical protein BJ741DRAFT_586391 [Chytriomyces cf. hyalinus JEL632]